MFEVVEGFWECLWAAVFSIEGCWAVLTVEFGAYHVGMWTGDGLEELYKTSARLFDFLWQEAKVTYEQGVLFATNLVRRLVKTCEDDLVLESSMVIVDLVKSC